MDYKKQIKRIYLSPIEYRNKISREIKLINKFIRRLKYFIKNKINDFRVNIHIKEDNYNLENYFVIEIYFQLKYRYGIIKFTDEEIIFIYNTIYSCKDSKEIVFTTQNSFFYFLSKYIKELTY